MTGTSLLRIVLVLRLKEIKSDLKLKTELYLYREAKSYLSRLSVIKHCTTLQWLSYFQLSTGASCSDFVTSQPLKKENIFAVL